eukprot:XP_001710094.1 Hypothetical protein GL50803_38378 [Giardia lamblia ATCC 50803]
MENSPIMVIMYVHSLFSAITLETSDEKMVPMGVAALFTVRTMGSVALLVII